LQRISQKETTIIPENDVKISKLIGTGNFGEVYLGVWGAHKVALKKLKATNNFNEFLSEVNMLGSLVHPNIVRFFGVYINATNDKYLVTEYCLLGGLDSYLRTNQFAIEPKVLLNLCYQISLGMLFLHKKNIIHRDLGCRNILLSKEDDTLAAKISDFGLSRITNYDGFYQSDQSKPLPVKWSAPECFNSLTFSTKSDVWSFGVLMWEIYSFGNLPFPGLSNAEVVQKVAREEKLEKPNSCPVEFYDVMLSCWKMNPKERPDFDVIRVILEKLNEKHSLLALHSSTIGISRESNYYKYEDEQDKNYHNQNQYNSI